MSKIKPCHPWNYAVDLSFSISVQVHYCSQKSSTQTEWQMEKILMRSHLLVLTWGFFWSAGLRRLTWSVVNKTKRKQSRDSFQFEKMSKIIFCIIKNTPKSLRILNPTSKQYTIFLWEINDLQANKLKLSKQGLHIRVINCHISVFTLSIQTDRDEETVQTKIKHIDRK